MALRVLRLVAVASILALALTVRAAPTASAHVDPPADEPPSVIVLPPIPIEIPVPPVPVPELPPIPIDPPVDLPPVLDPPPLPAPVDPPADPPADLPAEPPAEPAPPPSADDPADDPVEDPDPGTPIPPLPSVPPLPEVPPLPPVPPLPDPLEPLPTSAPVSEAAPVDVPVVDEPTTADPAVKDTAGPVSTPSTQNPRGPDGARVEDRDPVQALPLLAAPPAAAPAAAPPSAAYQVVTPGGRPSNGSILQIDEGPRHATASGIVLPESLDSVSAGIVASLAVTNRAPSVAVAIEFGRAGSGWAGAIVFNIWLRRQLRERRMSQRQLAAMSGVDHSTISRLLQQDRRPSLSTATKLARALRHVEGETDTADYFERLPEESLFPARRVEMALRADDLLRDEDVLRLMSVYLDARRRRLGTSAADGRAPSVRALRSSTIPLEEPPGSSSHRAASESASRSDHSPGTGSASARRRDPAAGQ